MKCNNCQDKNDCPLFLEEEPNHICWYEIIKKNREKKEKNT